MSRFELFRPKNHAPTKPPPGGCAEPPPVLAREDRVPSVPVQYAPFDRHSSAARLDSRSGATSVRPRRPAERHRPGFCRKAVLPALSGYDRGLSGNGALHGGQFQRQSLCAGDRPLGCALVCGVADQLPPALWIAGSRQVALSQRWCTPNEHPLGRSRGYDWHRQNLVQGQRPLRGTLGDFAG
jgi:hypothetical protein